MGKLASQNSVRINVISYDEENKEFFPVLVDQSTDPSLPVITLLLLGGEHSTHYVLVKSLNALLRPENTRTQRFHCPRFVPHNLNYPSNYILLPRCFHGYISKEGLDKHLENCVTRKVQGTRFPEDTHIEFKLYKKQVKCPVIIVCDFESYLENTIGGTSATRRTKHHKACSFAYKRVTPFEKFQKDLVLWRDDGVRDVADVFSKCTPSTHPPLPQPPSFQWRWCIKNSVNSVNSWDLMYRWSHWLRNSWLLTEMRQNVGCVNDHLVTKNSPKRLTTIIIRKYIDCFG